MRYSRKALASMLTLIMIASSLGLLMVKPAYAQSITKPIVPQFSVTFVGLWYDSTALADNRTLVFTIKNQPFTPYNNSDGNEIGLYYNFRVKEHFGSQWYYYPFGPNGHSTWLYGIFDYDNLSGPFFNSSNTENTTAYVNFFSFFDAYTFPSNSQLDIQVQAQVGHISLDYTGLMAGSGYNFTGSSSDWSNSHTITLTEGSTSTDISSSPYPTSPATPLATTTPAPTATVPEFSLLASVPLLLSTFAVAVIVGHRRISNQQKS
jgi:hypothetical protein